MKRSIAPLFRPSFLFWMVVVAAAALFGATTPLFETIGYEYALLASMVLSIASGHLASTWPHRVRTGTFRLTSEPFPIVRLYFQGLQPGLLLYAVMLSVILLNGLRVSPCNLREGILFFLLMPLPSVCIAAGIGLIVGLLTRGPKVASAVWVLIYITSIWLAFLSFYSTPAVHVFHPFFGYYPGVLYDRLIQVDGRLVSYRVATLLQVLAMITAAESLIDGFLRLAARPFHRRRGMSIASIVFVLGAVLMQIFAHPLGHRTTRNDLVSHLTVTRHTEQLDLFFPELTDEELADLLTKDARFSLHQVKTYLGINGTGRIAVFFFKDSADKQRMMGAANTNVAKPWRREVYVIMEPPPHPVLRHELVHAVSEAWGKGPFSISGTAGGLLPNPGLIEGLAGAAQGPRGDLTLHQWSAAMLSLDLLPRADMLFGLGFFNLDASRGYAAAGSFCQWIRDTFGKERLRLAYHQGDVAMAVGSPLADLDKAWREYLRRIPLTAADRAAAKHRFDRPPIIRSRCVHEVARLYDEAARCRNRGAREEAIDLLREAHRRSGETTTTRREIFFGLVDVGHVAEARKMGKHLLGDSSTGVVERNIIEEILTDLDASQSRPGEVRDAYRLLAQRAGTQSDRRRLQVKAHLDGIEDIDRRLFEVLAIRPGPRTVSDTLAALLIADGAATHPADPILAYLHARQYFNQKDYPKALFLMEKAVAQGLYDTTPALSLEGRMMRAETLYHLGRLELAAAGFRAIATDAEVPLGGRELARDWDARVYFELNTRQSEQAGSTENALLPLTGEK